MFDEVFVSGSFFLVAQNQWSSVVLSLFNILLRRSLLRDLYEGCTGANYFRLVCGVSNGGAIDAKQRCWEILALLLAASTQTEDFAGNSEQFPALRLQFWVVRLTSSCHRYKGMAASATAGKTLSRGSTLTPQSTGAGFSQMGGRPGAQNESSGAAMSVLLSWHEKVVDIAGLGCVNRSMTDRRKV